MYIFVMKTIIVMVDKVIGYGLWTWEYKSKFDDIDN